MSVEDNINSLAALRTFSRMDPEALRVIAFAAETRNLHAGDILFRQGDIADCGFFILSGAVTLDGAKENGSANKITKAGDLLGEFALMIATKRPVTAIARQNSVVLRISRALFLRVLEDYPASAERLRQDLLTQINALSAGMDVLRRELMSENVLAS